MRVSSGGILVDWDVAVSLVIVGDNYMVEKNPTRVVPGLGGPVQYWAVTEIFLNPFHQS